MNVYLLIGLLVPFLGTALGSMMVLFMKNEMNPNLQRILTGFAAGVMVSASFWSLLIPAVNQASEESGKLAVLPTSIGFCLGMAFLLLIDTLTPHMHLDETLVEIFDTLYSSEDIGLVDFPNYLMGSPIVPGM